MTGEQGRMSGGGIVERLRAAIYVREYRNLDIETDLVIEAAAEIARLQAALEAARTALHAAQGLPAAPAAQSAPERAGGLSGRPCVCCPDAYACAQAGCQLERRLSPEGTP